MHESNRGQNFQRKEFRVAAMQLTNSRRLVFPGPGNLACAMGSGRTAIVFEHRAMTRASKRKTNAEALNFHNPSRSYDETRRAVLFWGYDRALEVSFIVEQSALTKVCSETTTDEAGFLNAFDANRDRICAVAGTIYARRKKTLHLFSYTLTDSDF